MRLRCVRGPRAWAALIGQCMVCLAMSGVARAQEPEVRVRASLRPGGHIRMVDDGAGGPGSGRVLIDRSADHPVWTVGSAPAHQPLAPTLDLASRPDGFDLTATYVNATDKVRSMGVISIPGIRFGRVVRSRDFYVDGKAKTLDHQDRRFFGGGNVYPGSSYAPVALIGDDQHTLGLSVAYPIFEYKHKLWIRVESADGPDAPGGQSWQLRVELNPAWRVGDQYHYSSVGDMNPGETRVYRFYLRVMRTPADPEPGSPAAAPDAPQTWLRLFEPYRLYHRWTHGPVAYTRDARPVLAATIAYPGEINEENPYGFQGAELRPDYYGWEPWVNRLRGLAQGGWRRFMLWAPTGQFFTNRLNNYPWQFTTGWQREPMIRDTLGMLASFGGEVPELGLWWGHAANYMSRWDAEETALLDPGNPVHRAAAHAELDGAAAVGARMIGLDTFPRLPEWESIPYLSQLQARYPGTRYVVEPMPCDILHRVAGAYILATRPQSQIALQVENPLYMADFLNPGHETWGGVHEGDIKEALGLPGTAAIPREVFLSWLGRYASWGLVVAPYTVERLGADEPIVRAQASWERTVPGGAGALPEPVPPRIVAQPTGFARTPGLPGVLRVVAEGSDLTYRWRRDGVWLASDGRLDGADGPELRLTPVMGGDGGVYEVEVSNPLGSAVSAAAEVVLECLTDFDGDGAVTPDDLSDYLGGYLGGTGDPRLDFNGDGSIDPDDIADYISTYFLGC